MISSYAEHVSGAAAENIRKWLSEPKYAEYLDELQAMITAEKWDELEDAFYTQIEFGTAGIRGMTGLGSARISRVTIAEATQGLCIHAAESYQDATERGIVIACDTRLTSDEFSKLAAAVCAGNGFKAYLFDGYRSTPELSFAVRHLNAAAGIVISASHNLPTDNGFKAYMADGGQLVAPHDKAVTEHVRAVERIRMADYDAAVADGQIELIGEEVDIAYQNAVLEQSETEVRSLSVSYSPLHGAGQRNALPVLARAGFDVLPVAAQMTPDGHFPSVENNKPNPEERAANELAVAQMMSERTDLAITNDPDADRIGVVVRQNDEPKYLSGNQSAALAVEYSLKKLAQNGKVSKDHFIVNTIVTSDMLSAIADHYGVKVYRDLLIGFKYIGELLLEKEQTPETFVIGAEESYGMLKGDYARDKDGAVGALILAEYAAELKSSNKTMYDRLLEMYREYGFYVERLDTIVCPGAKGFEQMAEIMRTLRTDPPTRIGNHPVTAICDYTTSLRTYADGISEPLPCKVTSNVIVLELGDTRRRITIRPSGTEPKLKLYVQWYEEPDFKTGSDTEDAYGDIMDMIGGLSKELEGTLL